MRSRFCLPLVLLSAVWLTACAQSGPAPAALPASSKKSPGPDLDTDVLVVGGTPSGIAAALAAARQGAKVVLAEPHDHLGGDIVYAMLNMFDVPMRPDGTSPVATGIFGEFFRPLGIGFDINKARDLFESTVKAEPGITLFKRTHVTGTLNDGSKLTGAVLHNMPGGPNPTLPAEEVNVTAKTIIDASNDATFAARAGAQFYLGRQAGGTDIRQQAVGLLFSVKGANWAKMCAYVAQKKPMPAATRIGQEHASDVAPTTSKEVAAVVSDSTPKKPILHRLGGVDGKYIWERGDVIKGYKPRNPNVMVLSVNFGLQSDGTVVLNTLNAVGVNGLDPKDAARARKSLINELTTYIPYLRTAMPGLENIQLARIAPELYIRETRHMKALYNLSVADVRGQRKFPDRMTVASYPLDLHPYFVGQINPFGPKRYYYTIPMRSLVPKDIDGIYVASRCLGASYEAAGSARVIPITMGAGQAVGVAAAYGVKNGLTPQQIAADPQHITNIQKLLRDSGADVGDTYPVK